MSERQNEPKIPAAGRVPAAQGSASPAAMSPETASLLSLIDRLGSLLERSDVVEIEVESGETGIVLRKPAALAQTVAVAAAIPAAGGEATAGASAATAVEPAPSVNVKTVKAPLTGVFYSSSSPTSPPFVTVGQHVAIGQVIGLIEAMKLFNEIKSDQAGKLIRIVAETGKLVKAKQPLIEVEP